MSLVGILLVVILIFVLLPNVGWYRGGYGPSGLLGVVLVILVIWLLLGHRF